MSRGRPRTNPRTVEERAAYAELHRRLRELQARRRQSDMQRLNGLLLEYAVPKARKVLIDAFAELDPEARHALALKLVSDDDD